MEKKAFLNSVLGRDVEGNPYAFHLEGFTASKDPKFVEAADGKDAFLGIAIGVGRPADALLALAKGEYSKDAAYSLGEFVGLRLYGKLAEEFSKAYKTGVKIAVSGKLGLRDYDKSDGSKGQEVTCNVSKLVIMGGKETEPQLTDSINATTYVYEDKKVGGDRSIGMAGLLTGTVVGTPALRESNGKKFFTFGLKTKLPAAKVYDLANGLSRDGYEASKTIVNVTVFDRQAETLANLLRAGAQCVVTGPVREREYNGNTSYNMNARAVGIMKLAPLPAGSEAAGPAPAGTAAAAAAEAAGAAASTLPQSDFVDLGDEEEELPF